MRTQNSPKERDPENETTRTEAETVATLAACLVSEVEERGVTSVGPHPQGKTDSPSKRKGNGLMGVSCNIRVI